MLQYFPNITGSLQVTGSVSVSGSITATGGIIVSGSIASASYSSNSELLDNLDSTAFVFTSSFNTYSSSMSTRTTTLENASASLNTASGSFSGRVTKIEGNYATTGSNIFTGAQTVCANITSTGTIIAQTLNVQQVTSSIVYSSGSNIFGCSLANTQQFTGSVTITGSLGVSGNTCVGGTITGTTVYGSTLVCSAMVCSPQSAFTYTGTTGNAVRINGDNLTTGTALSIVANNGSPSHTGNVVEICNAFNAGAAAKLLCLYQGDDGDGIYVNMARGGVGLTIDGVGSGYSAIFNNGNVGIGCTAPSQKLDIGSGHIKLSDGYGLFYGTQTQVYASEASKYVRFDIAGTSGVMFLTGSGNVGIGTTTPFAKLEIVGGNNLPPSTGTQNYTVALRDPTSMVADVGGSILLQGFKTSNTAIGNFAYIAGKKENGTAGNEAGYLSLGTFDSSGIPAERMRIASNGVVRIGACAINLNTNSNVALQVAGAIRFGNPDGEYSQSYGGGISARSCTGWTPGSTQIIVKGLGGSGFLYQVQGFTAAGKRFTDLLFGINNTFSIIACATESSPATRCYTITSENLNLCLSGTDNYNIVAHGFGAVER